jgi:hypothetical protein
MRANPGYRNWAERVVALSHHEELEPFRRLLGELIEDRLATLEPLARFTEEGAHSIPLESYLTASRIGEAEINTNPCAGFIVTWVSLIGWGHALGDRLYTQVTGMPHYGWAEIPYAYASAALKLGDLYGTKAIVDQSYNVLMAAKYNYYSDIREAVRKYRALAFKIYQRLELAIGNLVDDLHHSAHPAPVHFRAELMALLWTLGFVPECQSLRFSDYVPSRSFLKKIVWLSLERLPVDPLTQFVWLEMKDKPPFSLRDHRPLFDRINSRYHQYLPDELWEIIPSQIYAQTLIAWLKGEVNSDQVGRYLAVIAEVQEYEETRHSIDKADWSIYLRMVSLANVLAREFDCFKGDVSKERELKTWHSLWSQAARMRRQYHLNPHYPDLIGTLNYPLFHFVEHELDADESKEAVIVAKCKKIIRELEQYRAAALSYSLTVSVPFVSEEEKNTLDDLLKEEHTLLQWLRGAFFLIHYEFLPEHFHRFATDYSWYVGGNDPKRFLNLETGRKEYAELEERLKALFQKMKSLAPKYAARRIDPCAGRERIIGALRKHSVDAS